MAGMTREWRVLGVSGAADLPQTCSSAEGRLNLVEQQRVETRIENVCSAVGVARELA